jgi:hypothetical protein
MKVETTKLLHVANFLLARKKRLGVKSILLLPPFFLKNVTETVLSFEHPSSNFLNKVKLKLS